VNRGRVREREGGVISDSVYADIGHRMEYSLRSSFLCSWLDSSEALSAAP